MQLFGLISGPREGFSLNEVTGGEPGGGRIVIYCKGTQFGMRETLRIRL